MPKRLPHEAFDSTSVRSTYLTARRAEQQDTTKAKAKPDSSVAMKVRSRVIDGVKKVLGFGIPEKLDSVVKTVRKGGY